MNNDKLDSLLEGENTPEQRTDYMAFTKNIAIVLAFVLMIAVPLFQWLEIQEYDIQDDMFERLANIFESEETSRTSSDSAQAKTEADTASSESTDKENDASGEKSEDDGAEKNPEEAPAE